VSGTIPSKRKLITLIEGQGPDKPNRGKYVKGWDDPRLFTLVGLRRRGIPPGAILSFVNELGVTKATSTIEIPRFENSVRTYLETSVPRLMLVLDPVPIIIENLPDDYVEMVELPYSKDPSYGVCESYCTRCSSANKRPCRLISSLLPKPCISNKPTSGRSDLRHSSG
jgi:glutaminyl-tRNA synthetase